MLRKLTLAALLLTVMSAGAAAQNNAAQVIAAASKAMGVDNLNSITYSGTARNGQFGQSRSIGNPLGPTNTTVINEYTRTITFVPNPEAMALVIRTSGTTMPPTVPGVPAPMPGMFNQNVTTQQASNNWGQALNVWLSPWGCLKGAAANNATVRSQGGNQLVTFAPSNFKSPSGQMYSVTCTINNQNLVTKTETRVEHPVAGDLLIEFEYTGYRNMNGVQVPARIVQRQAGLESFNADITAATANPPNLAELLTAPPAPARGGGAPPAQAPAAGRGAAAQGDGGRGRAGGAPAADGRAGGAAQGRAGGAPQQAGGRGGGPPAAPEVTKLGEGVFKIGGNYTALAIDMGDHILVVESGQSDARGMAVMAAAKEAIPNKPIRFVVNSHPHFDHASGLAAAVAEGATILTHENNEDTLEDLLSNPRTLVGDSLSKQPNRRAQVDGIGDREVRRGQNGKVVEIHRVDNVHSDGLVMVYLPAERVLWSADITIVNPTPAQMAVVRSADAAIKRLNLQYDTWIPAHAPNPDRPLTKADFDMVAAQEAAPPAN